MRQKLTWKRNVQLVAAVFCALGLKLYYSAASPNQLRWILAPTTALVQIVTGASFQFESHAGYIISDRSFIIAASCAGVNFLITAFLMLSLRKLWRDPAQKLSWSLIPAAGLFAFLATLAANTVRISLALWLQHLSPDIGGLSRNELHRFEGIFVYFGFLLLLFVISDRLGSENGSGLFRRFLFPLLIYYTTTLGIPLVNTVYHRGFATSDFWEHFCFVLLTPLLLILPLAAVRFCKDHWLPQCSLKQENRILL